MDEAFRQFAARWLPLLNNGARAQFHHRIGPIMPAPHSEIADGFIGGLGFAKIGFNWELLDALPGADGPRSAWAQMEQALAGDIANPARPWLAQADAAACARDFIALFDPERRTLVANRYDGLWNPIAGAAVEWAFVGFDDKAIALLLITDT
ncbi:hypothetical protein [Qipengyuania sp. ASV99]|uniref:hypothetical protein n=1 Tax=Qipengyuania sp. ASV99 TaxID=3399681 RepID=UPI003A4C7FB5